MFDCRADDNIQTIKKRFDTFHKETEPVIASYEAKGMVVEVNAENAPPVVYEELQKKLAEKNMHPKPKSNNIPQVVFVLGGPGCGKGT